MIKVVDKVIWNNAFTTFLQMIPINPTETAALAVASCPIPGRACCWIGNSGDKIACVVVVYTELWNKELLFSGRAYMKAAKYWARGLFAKCVSSCNVKFEKLSQ